MEKLLYTPEEISEQKILPYKPRTIYQMVRDGRISVRRQRGHRIVIHKDAIAAFAKQFLGDENGPAAGPHVHKEAGTCRKSKKASSREVVQRKSGLATQAPTASRLDALLASGPIHGMH